MNESEIRSLTGLELDAAIAEMMGWKKLKKQNWDYWCWVNEHEAPVAEYDKFHPSTSWVDFGIVVAWMEREGWEHSHGTFSNFQIEWSFFPSSGDFTDEYTAVGSTLPEAAGRAALLTRMKGE